MDARIVKTRRSLQDALFALVNEHGIDEVSIADIAQRAGVNRTTFYLHYSDKETLLADALEAVAMRAGARIEHIDVSSTQPPVVLVDFLIHVDTYGDLYHRIFTEPGYGVVLARLRAQMIAAIERVADETSADRPHDLPLHFLASGIAGSMLGMLGAWLDETPRASPQDAARWTWAVLPLPREAPRD